MKKALTLLTCLLVVGVMLYAQEKQSKFLIELSAGPSFPIGNFADKSYKGFENNTPAGLAKTGLGAQLSLGYYINENAGLLLSSGYSVHAQDPAGYEEYYTAGINRPTSQVEVTTKKWKMVKLIAGGFLVTPLTAASDLNLLTKLTAGVCKTAVPEYTWTVYNQDGSMQWSTNKEMKLPWSFCYQVSVGLQYKLNKTLHVLLDINSFNSTAQKEFYSGTDFPSGPPDVFERIKYKLAEVNVLAGIGFSF